MNMEKIVATYIKMRDALTEKRRAFEADERGVKEQMKILEGAMLQHLQNAGADSVTTSFGTFYKQVEVTPTGSDWDAFYAWVAENNEFEALERRIKKTFIKDYMEAHDGTLPPGVSVYKEYVVRVRRS